MKITIAFDFIIPPLQHTSNVASQAAAGVLAISFCFSRRLPTVDEGSSFLRATVNCANSRCCNGSSQATFGMR